MIPGVLRGEADAPGVPPAWGFIPTLTPVLAPLCGLMFIPGFTVTWEFPVLLPAVFPGVTEPGVFPDVGELPGAAVLVGLTDTLTSVFRLELWPALEDVPALELLPEAVPLPALAVPPALCVMASEAARRDIPAAQRRDLIFMVQ